MSEQPASIEAAPKIAPPKTETVKKLLSRKAGATADELDAAQREACAAYILSQRHEGCTMLPDVFDDGGFSGGNMDRLVSQAAFAMVKASRCN
jgi:hypothetical protein